MTIGAKVALSFILFGGIGTIIYLKVQQNKKAAPPSDSGTPPTSNSTAPASNMPATPPASVAPPAPVAPVAPPDSRIGRTATAKYGQLAVYNKGGSLYKTANQGDWIGTISSVSAGKIWLEGDSLYVFDTTTPSINTNFSGFSGIRVRRKRFNEQV